MKEFKEKPKLGKAKEKPKSALLPRQAVHMMKEKYIKEMDQRPKEAGGSTQQAPDQVEHAGRWAADELTGRAVEQGRQYAKKKFAAARGEAQASPEAVPHGDNGPSAEGAPGGQSAPEYPATTPMEHRETEPSPITPREHLRTEYTANPIKDRQMVEHRVERRTAAQGQAQPYRTAQTTRSGQPHPHEGTCPLKERPAAQVVKERPVVDMPRTADRHAIPRTAAGQFSAVPGRRSEAVPFKVRPQQAVKERTATDIARTVDRAAPPRAATPRAAIGQASTASGGRPEAVPLKVRQQKALKERPQLRLRGRGAVESAPVPAPGPAHGPDPGPDGKAPRPTKAALSPKVRRGVVKAPTNPAARAGVSGARALKTAQKQMQHRMFTQAIKPAKSIGAVFRRAVQAVAKAAAAVTGAASAVVGGCVVLVALVIVIVIAAVANSPFGLFFAQEPNAPGTVSVSQAVGSVNMAYNAKLELLQSGDYDSIDIQGVAPDWPDVLAVFAVKVAGADVDGMDVATLDPDRVDKLTAVFWDMTDVATRVETIDHPATDTAEAWTEKILHITITPKAADDMRTAYACWRTAPPCPPWPGA